LLEKQEQYVSALLKEIEHRKNYITNPTTIYLGGGTPSTLPIALLERIFTSLDKNFNLSKLEEVTIECNPDDLNIDYVKGLKSLPINRLSMGIQTFNEEELKVLGRRHNAKNAIKAVENVHNSGIKNISIDLMYALPGQSLSTWEENLNTALSLPISHISAYHLSYEEDTPLYKLRNLAFDEEKSLEFFELLSEKTAEKGFEHYEISNWAKDGKYSKHNSAYWQNKPYLGIGAGAHSYNLNERRWNFSSLNDYINGVLSESEYSENEILTSEDKYNDLIITQLRTKWGLDINLIEGKYLKHFQRESEKFVKENHLKITNENRAILTHSGIFISDYIMRELIVGAE
jgi:oxygen-independent coproporphyrinogen-3 oxidase